MDYIYYIVHCSKCYVLLCVMRTICTICTVWYKINPSIGLLVICCAFRKLSSHITLTCREHCTEDTAHYPLSDWKE